MSTNANVTTVYDPIYKEIFDDTPTSNDLVNVVGDFTIVQDEGTVFDIEIAGGTLAPEIWKDVDLKIGTNSTSGLQNGTIVDRSTNNRTMTLVGEPTQTTFHPYLNNWSVEFDGTGDYLSIVDNTMISTGEFTVEGWFYSTSTSAQVIFHWSDISDGNDNDLILDTSGVITCRVGSGGGTSTSSAGGLWSTNTWHHFAVVRDSSNNIDVYLDGTHIIDHGVRTDDMDNTLEIGRNPYQGGRNYFNGYISNFRIVESTLYTTNFTPPTEKLTAITNAKLLINGNRFADFSTNNYNVTPVGNVKVSAFNPFGQVPEYTSGENKGSVFLDGVDDYSYTLDTGIVLDSLFTIEAWCYLNDFTTNNALFSQKASGAVISTMQIHTNGFYMQIYGGNRGNQTGTLSRDNTDLLNRWAHIAVEWTGSAFEYFVDGVSVGTHAITTNWHYSGIDYFTQIGVYNYSSPNSHFSGYMSDFRITAGSRVYGGAYTPPTEPVGSTGATLYLPYDNLGIFDKTTKQELTLVGDVATSDTQTKFNDTSIYFDGSGDYISIPYTSDYIFNTDVTVEFWIYFVAAASSNSALLAQGYNGSSPIGWTLFTSNAGNLNFYASTGGSSWTLSQFDTGISQSTGAWKHVAIVRNGNDLTFYDNGVSTATTTSLSNFTIGATDRDIYIASNVPGTQYTFNGQFYLENFQIINGVAKYTENFTPENLPEITGTQIIQASVDPANITGGQQTFVQENGQWYAIHAFTANGTLDLTNLSGNVTADVLVVGGGGGGGSHVPGGGGAGGLIYRPALPLTGGTDYHITVGGGGLGSHNVGNYAGMPNASRGGDSSFDTLLTALGGGFGDSWEQDSRSNDGGSGGGANTLRGTAGVGLQPSQSGDSGTYGFGNDGGSSGYGNPYPGPGGGGAGEPGYPAPSGSVSGNGGDGKYYGDIFGDTYGDEGWFAGGGGGGAWGNVGQNFGDGGKGGGGAGDCPNGGSGTGTSQRLGSGSPLGENGQINTGGGGGGAGATGGSPSRGGDGGSGIVLVRIPLAGVAITKFDNWSASNYLHIAELDTAGSAQFHSFALEYKGTSSATNASGDVALALFGDKDNAGAISLGIDNGKIAVSDGTNITRGSTTVNDDAWHTIVFAVGETGIRGYVDAQEEFYVLLPTNLMDSIVINSIGHFAGATNYPEEIGSVQLYGDFLFESLLQDPVPDSFIQDPMVTYRESIHKLDNEYIYVDSDIAKKPVYKLEHTGIKNDLNREVVTSSQLIETFDRINTDNQEDTFPHKKVVVRVFALDAIKQERWF